MNILYFILTVINLFGLKSNSFKTSSITSFIQPSYLNHLNVACTWHRDGGGGARSFFFKFEIGVGQALF